MKIVLVSPIPPPAGGIASWTKRYLNSEKAKKNEVLLVNTAIIGKRKIELSKRNLISEIKRTYNIIKNLKNILKTEKDIDVVHLNTSCGKFGIIRDYLIGKKVKKYGIKLLVHFRCDIGYMIKDKMAKLYLKKLLNYSNIIITLNESSKRYIKDNFGFESIILPNFVSDDYIENTKTNKKINIDMSNIIFVGHVTKQKGCDLIYEIANEFPNIKFNLIGYISDEIKRLDKPCNVELKGEIELSKVKMYLEESDVFLFPTHTEGFPNVISEAMACGLPIISTNVGAIPDMIEDNGGILCEVDNKEAFGKAIEKIKDNTIREKMSLWNQKKVQENYFIDTILDKLFEIYKL